MLGDLEIQAKEQGLQFIEELIFENGAVYRGKFSMLESLPLTRSSALSSSLPMLLFNRPDQEIMPTFRLLSLIMAVSKS